MKSPAIELIPLGCFAILLAFAGAVFFDSGVWPSYGNPDPKDTAFASLIPLIMAVVTTGVLASLLGGGWRLVQRMKGQVFTLKSDGLLTTGALLWLTDLSLLFTSNHSLINWMLD